MRFLEYETWRLKKNIDPAAYDKIISDWFKFLKDNYDELFPEWVSAKYYRQTDREGNPTGVFIMEASNPVPTPLLGHRCRSSQEITGSPTPFSTSNHYLWICESASFSLSNPNIAA